MELIKTSVKGMPDQLPKEVKLRENILKLIKDTYSSYGFEQIETPAIEHLENLTSKQGGDNEKLIFRILRRGEDLKRELSKPNGDISDCGLRYDLTVPLARYYSNNISNLPMPFKALQIGNVWRADKPQKGRLRQFVQCDIDILGDNTNLSEIELIVATTDVLSLIFKDTTINSFTVHVNDRRILRAFATYAGFLEEEIDSVLISLDKYDKIGIDGIYNELVSKGFDEKTINKYLSIYNNISNDQKCEEFCDFLVDKFISKDVITNIEEIITTTKALIKNNIRIIFDPTLVRGMGYYTGTIFEISVDDYNFSIAGGGRYDRMIERFCGIETCACGFSIGFERIITILKDLNYNFKNKDDIFIAYLLDKNITSNKKIEVLKEANEYRREGYTVVIQPMRKNLKVQINKLESMGYSKFVKIYN